jgi:hypothetical protein
MDKMYVIPVIFVDENGKIDADSCGVSKEELIEWLEGKTMPKALISAEFVEQYFNKHGYFFDLDTIIIKEHQRLYPQNLPINTVKKTLDELGINIDDFLNEYKEYLRKLLIY